MVTEFHLNKGYVLWILFGCGLTISVILLAALLYRGVSSNRAFGAFDVALVLLLAFGGPTFFWVGEFAVARPITSYSIESDGLRLTELSILSGRRHIVAPWWTLGDVDNFLFESGKWYTVSIRFNRSGGVPEKALDGRVIHSREIVRRIIIGQRDWELLKSHLPTM